MPTPFSVYTSQNRVIVAGPLKLKDLRKVLAAAHYLVTSSGYRDIEFDFSNCDAAFAGPMLGIAAIAERYLVEHIDVDLTLPKDQRLARLFLNANWAHLIDPRRYEPSSYRGTAQIPAARYNSGEEQASVVTKLVNKILTTLSDFDREHIKAIEWAINEITDNVLNHSQSPIGGLLQVTNFAYRRRSIDFCVCDPGVGIPQSLRAGRPAIGSDHEALDSAIREGVSRSAEGQGNGLYGSWRITQISGGSMEIHSGYGSLVSFGDRLHIRPESIPFAGTLVAVSINYDRPLSLKEALRFRGQSHDPIDLVQLTYEETEDGFLHVNLARESAGFGSRAAGAPIRTKLKNLIRIGRGKKIIVDFQEVPIISSSFADEVFGKLFLELGPLTFMKLIEFRRVDDTIKGLIDRAIEQRARTGLSG